MEALLENLKAYIIANLPGHLSEIATEEIPLPDLVESTVIVGDCDIAKHSAANTLFINPDSIAFTDLSISDYEQGLSLDFLMVCRNSPPAILFKRVLRYIEALKEMFVEDLNLSGIGTIDIKTGDYFDGMEGNTSIKGFMLSCDITW